MSSYLNSCCVPHCDRRAETRLNCKVETTKGITEEDLPLCFEHEKAIREEVKDRETL